MKKSMDQKGKDIVNRAEGKRKRKFLENDFEKTRPLGQEILAAMNFLDEELVELAPQEEMKREAAPKKMAARRFQWAAAAVCALCLISGSVVFAASRMNWHVEEYVDENYPEPDVSKYYVDLLPQKVSADVLSEQVREIAGTFKEEARIEAENGIYSSGDVPYGWVREFENTEEAIDFVGFEGLRETGLPDWEIDKNVLVVLGTGEGVPIRVEVNSYYKLGEKLTMLTEARIYTEDWPYERIGTAKPFYNFEEIAGEEYLTKSGKTGLIMAPKYDGEGFFWMEGFMVEEEIVYYLWVSYNSGNLTERGLAKDAVAEAMHDWMDQF